MSGVPEERWRLEYYEVTSQVTGQIFRQPIMTNGRCRITTLRRGPSGHRFRYEDMWTGTKLEFEFAAVLLGGILSTTYQVMLGSALVKHQEYWTGSPRDNELLNYLMTNTRHALLLLRSGPSEESRIKTVEFVLSNWPHWRTLSGFRTSEVVR